jgi:hypothetical protein
MHKLLQRGGSGPATRVVATAMALVVLLVNAASGRAETWKNCSFNDRPIPCRDSHSPDGTLRITWQRQILIQGNAVFTNPANGNRISALVTALALITIALAPAGAATAARRSAPMPVPRSCCARGTPISTATAMGRPANRCGAELRMKGAIHEPQLPHRVIRGK